MLVVLLGFVALTTAVPVIQKTINGEPVGPYSDSPITLDAGNVGVNIGGLHASAGLGGLLTGDLSRGLHAEAGTPFGQEAGAGLSLAQNGIPQVSKYAYANKGGLPNVDGIMEGLRRNVEALLGKK